MKIILELNASEFAEFMEWQKNKEKKEKRKQITEKLKWVDLYHGEITEKDENIDVESLQLTVRTSNCLRNSGINSLADLLKQSESSLLKIGSLGRKSLHEIKEELSLSNRVTGGGLCLTYS